MRAFIKNIFSIKKGQSGFSLIELLAAIAISGIIVVGLVMTIFQLYNGHAQASGEINVIRQVQQAGYYISRDTQMAKYVSVDDDPGTAEVEVATLTWYWYFYDINSPAERDGEGNMVIYTLEDGELYRNYYFAVATDPPYDYVLQSSTFIAKYIQEINTSYDGDKLTMTVTASIENIAGLQEETRTYEAKTRPDVF
jgi:prepilin-type N-terminal cleavage/methylation domain-containing protein